MNTANVTYYYDQITSVSLCRFDRYPHCGTFFNALNIWRLVNIVLLSLSTFFVLYLSFTRVHNDLFKYYTVNLYCLLVILCFSQSTNFIVTYLQSRGIPTLFTGTYSCFTLTTLFINYLISYEFKIMIVFLIGMTYICYSSPLIYLKYFAARKWKYYFACGHATVTILASLRLLTFCSDKFRGTTHTAVITVYMFLQIFNVALSIAVTLSLILCVRAVIRSRPNSKNYRRLISLLVYNIPPAIMFTVSIPTQIMATYYSFLSTEQMMQHPLYELFSTLTSIQNRYTEVRPFVLTICTIVAYQQYRLAALSILYCKPVGQLQNSRRKVQVVSCSPRDFGGTRRHPVTALKSVSM